MKQRQLTCIVCPRGCTLHVALDERGIPQSVTGNACKRGISYAEKECTHPERTVTSTVRTVSDALISVKTAAPVPKEKVFAVMAAINTARARDTVRIGDVIIPNAADTGIDVIATSQTEN